MRMAVRLIKVVWMLARYEECTGCMYDMTKVEEKRGGLAARAVIFRNLRFGKRAKPYESTGTSKCLAPCKLHAKSLAICENNEFLSHCLQYSRTHCLHIHNYSLLYQFHRT